MYFLYIALVVGIGMMTCKCPSWNEKRMICRTQTTRYYLIFVSVLTFIYIAFRDISVGIDTALFEKVFWNINETMSSLRDVLASDRVEKGYAVLEYLIGRMGGNYRILLVISAVVCAAGLYCLLDRYAVNPVYSMILYIGFGYFSYSMCFIRQMMAVSIVLFALKFIEEKKLIPYTVTVLIASTIHQTALIALPFYFLCKAKLNRKTRIGAMILIVAANILRGVLYDFILNFARVDYTTSTETGGTLLNLMTVGTALLAIYYGPQILERYPISKLPLYAMIIAAMVYPVSLESSAVTRLFYYYHILIIVFVPFLYRAIPTRMIKFAVASGYLIAAVGFFYRIIMRANQFYPYLFM